VSLDRADAIIEGGADNKSKDDLGAGGRALIPKNTFGWPIPEGFASPPHPAVLAR
jgi:hypothetical protein